MLDDLLPDFFQECMIKEKEPSDVQECKDHFFNWARADRTEKRTMGKPQEINRGSRRKSEMPQETAGFKPNCGLIED
ncbi:DUF7833 domain-containing protein [Duncaniella dubosii]|uniref:DUF7833 domain-containing protein n=1 Tax=Duncaniella dubosii TaxID=2518971 RepID=UPI003F66F38F